MKYVMTDLFGIKIPIIFPDQYCHDMFAGKFIITSAGYVGITANTDEELSVTCSGNSTSLKMQPAPDDALIIENYLNLGDSAAIAIQNGIDVKEMLLNASTTADSASNTVPQDPSSVD